MWGNGYNHKKYCIRSLPLTLPKTAPIIDPEDQIKLIRNRPNTINIPFNRKILRDSNIVNRYVLTTKEHLKLLAQPRKVVYSSNILKTYKRPFKTCSPRLFSLSIPLKRKILSNWQRFYKVLPIRKLEKFIDFLHKDLGEMNIVDSIICKNVSKKCRFRRKLNACNKNKTSQIKCVINSISYWILHYLVDSPREYVLNDYQRNIFKKVLSYLIEKKLWNFKCRKLIPGTVEMEFIQVVKKMSLILHCILKQVQVFDFQNESVHSASDSKPSTASIIAAALANIESNESIQEEENRDKKSNQRRKHIATSITHEHSMRSKPPQKITGDISRIASDNIPSTSKELIPEDAICKSNIKEETLSETKTSAEKKSKTPESLLSVQEAESVHGEIEQLTSNSSEEIEIMKENSSMPFMVDCEENYRLLAAIRKYYFERTELHNKYILDDKNLPDMTLYDAMNYAEQVLNRFELEEPLPQLQRAFQQKITEWVNESTKEPWDDCMKADVHLLSYELARVITDETVEATFEERSAESEPSSPPKKRLRTPPLRLSSEEFSEDFRGIDLNVEHCLDITPHTSGTVCCASLKVWSAWIKDVADNAKLWCLWINQKITNMHYLSSLMRGEVYDRDGTQLKLLRCNWKEFVTNLEDDITAWHQYNKHVQELTDEITEYFFDKPVTCCPICIEENLNISDIGVEHLCEQLFEAMHTTKTWREWLEELVDETATLTCVPEIECVCPSLSEMKEVETFHKNPNHRIVCPPFTRKPPKLDQTEASVYSIEAVNNE